MTASGTEGTPTGPGQPPTGAPGSRGVDRGALRLADVAIAAGTLLYLVFMVIPWFSIDGFDLGSGYSIPGVSVNGFDSGALTLAFVLLLLASAWALLPAVADVAVPFPRWYLTAGLVALAFVLTLVEWLSTFEAGFTFAGLLTFLTSAALLAVAVLRVLPDLRPGGTLPGGLAGVARWADRPLGRSAGSASAAASEPGPGQAASGQAAPGWAPPPGQGQHPGPAQPPYGHQPPTPGGPPPV
ncbi:hypothetical protein [Modestobacter versicolor]|uniref:hypothetical protein n=1 Tax=Modestobacter versicolor TaxID=429133 RepID=UPI0034DECE33